MPRQLLCRWVVVASGSNDLYQGVCTAKATTYLFNHDVQGSGWCWLGYNREHERLEIATTANQDPLQAHKVR